MARDFLRVGAVRSTVSGRDYSFERNVHQLLYANQLHSQSAKQLHSKSTPALPSKARPDRKPVVARRRLAPDVQPPRDANDRSPRLRRRTSTLAARARLIAAGKDPDALENTHHVGFVQL